MLKAVIFGLEGVLIKDKAGAGGTGLVSASRDRILSELRSLFDFLRAKGVSPIVLSNRNWVLVQGSQRLPLKDVLLDEFGPHKLYVTSNGDLANWKPTKACI